MKHNFEVSLNTITRNMLAQRVYLVHMFRIVGVVSRDSGGLGKWSSEGGVQLRGNSFTSINNPIQC